MDIVQVHLAVVQPFAQRAAIAGFVHLQPGFPHALQRTRGVFRRRGRLGVFVALHADDIGNQHGVVRGHRAAGLGDDRRVRQAVLFAGVADGPDNIVSVFVQAVVHRAVGLRAGSFVIHTQATANVEALDINAQLMQLDVETRRFTHAGGDIANVGHLRAEVEVQQLQAVEVPCGTQDLHQLQNLGGRETELRLLTAGGLPFTGPLRGQTRTHAKARHHVQALGFFQHDGNFRHLLDDQIDLVAHLLAHQRQTDVFAVFITVTDDDAAGHPGVRQHGHQFRFRTGFQTQRLAGMDQRFDDATMLVHLDRVDQEVIAVIAVGFARALERGVD